MNELALEHWRDDIIKLRRICFDSNVLIYVLEERRPHAGYVKQLIGMLQANEVIGLISTTSEMELLVKPIQDRDSAAIDRIEAFLRETPNLFVRFVDRDVAREAARLCARHHGMRTADAVIAATALLENCDSIIGNDADFSKYMREERVPYLYLDDYIT